MDFPFLPGWSFIPVQKSAKPWHDPSSTFCSPGKQLPVLVHTCWREIRGIWVLCGSLSLHGSCWAVAEGLWGRAEGGGHFPSEKWLQHAISFSVTLHYRALFLSFSEFLVEWWMVYVYASAEISPMLCFSLSIHCLYCNNHSDYHNLPLQLISVNSVVL